MSAKKLSVLDIVKSRRTTYEFSAKKIGAVDLKNILEAARWAPSPFNSQPWKFIVVKDKKRIEKLVNISHYGNFHTDPPVLVVAVLEKMYDHQKGMLKGAAKEFVLSHKYFTIASPLITMTYAAKSLGIDSCILSLIVDKANRILSVPKGKEAILALGLGCEEKNAYHKKRERLNFSEIVRKEKYGKR